MSEAMKVARAANVLARWCALRDVSVLDREALADEAGLSEGQADLFVLFGGGVTGTIETLAAAMRAGVAQRYAIVGGRGHATYWLERAIEGLREKDDSLPVPGVASESEMLDALLFARHGLHADLLETRSTNCGNNITYLLDLLEGEGSMPASVILSQDAVMQRRMDVTWRRPVADRSPFAGSRVINWPAYEAELACEGGRLAWRQAPEGIWPMEKYLQLLLGEVERLTDDEHGYGPRGRDFVVHVDVPSEVLEAADVLRAACGESGRAPDERFG
jgi:uncharacterized SAM-binding protein YcdF (DUF218 family)